MNDYKLFIMKKRKEIRDINEITKVMENDAGS